LHKEPSNIFEVTHSSNVKERAIKIEERKKYLRNYVRYSDKLAHDLPGSERKGLAPNFVHKRAL
jgi:hypothetical protein